MSSAKRAPRGWSDRLNPVLVKELRAMLRGRFLPVLLLGTLSLVLAITLWIVFWTQMEPDSRMGSALFVGVYLTAHALIAVLPPLWAFTSLGQEFEEGSLDLLAIACLSPWGVVVGKFLAALVQAAAILCAVAPFMFFAFLLGGFDVFFVAGVLVSALASSAYSIALALAVSSLTHLRWARTLMMAGVFLWLAWEHGQAFTFFTDLSQIGQQISSGGTALWMLPNLELIFLEVGLLLAFAGGRLAHPEENRSGPLRRWCFALVVATFLGAWIGLDLGADPSIVDFYVRSAWSLGLVVLFLVSTEPDTLPRSWSAGHRASAPARWRRALFVAGGGRGALLGFVMLGLAALLAWIVSASRSSGTGAPWLDSAVVVFALPCVYILLPAGLLASRNTSPRATLRIRAGIVIGWCTFWGLCVFGSVVTGRDPDPRSNVLDPWYLHEVDTGAVPGTESLLVQQGLLLLLVIASVIVNAPRMLRGAREVLEQGGTYARIRHAGKPDAPPQP